MSASNAKVRSKVAARGRPNAERAARIDRLVLDTARRRFLSEGFEAVSLESIALEAGISKGTLYARHASKEALLLAVWEDAVNGWSRAAARNDYLLTDDIAQRLLHHARTIANSLMQEETLSFQRLIFANADRFPTIAREIHILGFRYIADLLARDMADSALRDGIPINDPFATAEAFVSMISGWMTQNSIVRNVALDEAEAFARHATNLFVAGREAW